MDDIESWLQNWQGDWDVAIPEGGYYELLEALRAAPAAAGVPDGWALVPKQFSIPAEAWDAAAFAYGGPATGEGEPHLDCTAWIGEVVGDDGERAHGLQISCDECPEEGSITLAEFPAAPEQRAALAEQQDAGDADHIERRLTAAMREADSVFQRVGGSTRHHVRDCLLPILGKHGLAITALAARQPVGHAVPEDVRRDAERYRFIRDADRSDALISYDDLMTFAAGSLDEAIDAAMAAQPQGEGVGRG